MSPSREREGPPFTRFVQQSHLPANQPLADAGGGLHVFEKSFYETPEQFERGIFGLRVAIAQHRITYDAIEKGDAVRAESMMREHTHTIIEYIQKLKKRFGRLTVADLIAYSAAQPAILVH